MNHIFTSDTPLQLELGTELKGFQVSYCTYGRLNSKKSNVVWVCHALTANADVFDWWKGLFGEGCLFNADEHFIVCANILGSCYGSTGPLSQKLEGGIYYHSFPEITVRDMVSLHQRLFVYLKLERIHTLIGGSLGGQQALEWAIMEPLLIENLVLIATNAFHSPWGIAFNETQRMAIESDATWQQSCPEAGIEGLKTARAIALLSYRNYNTFCATQAEEENSKCSGYRAASYQRYQGLKLSKRFNAFSYWVLLKAMDSHQIARGRKSLRAALGSVKASTLVIGVSSDLLFPVSEQALLAEHIHGAVFEQIESLYGHDGFLIETASLAHIISHFLNTDTYSTQYNEQAT